MLATNAVARLANFSRDGIGKPGANRPFFLSTGFHKPRLPHIVPKPYFDLYALANVSLAPNRLVPKGFKEENFHADGTFERKTYNLNAGPVFTRDGQNFSTPLDEDFRRGCVPISFFFWGGATFDAWIGLLPVPLSHAARAVTYRVLLATITHHVVLIGVSFGL